MPVVMATKNIVVRSAFGKRLELKDKSPAEVHYERALKIDQKDPLIRSYDVRILSPVEIMVEYSGGTEEAFSRTLAYFASPHMAAIIAASRVMFFGFNPDIKPNPGIPGVFELEIDDAPYRSGLFRDAFGFNWSHVLFSPDNFPLARMERHIASATAEMRQWSEFFTLAGPFRQELRLEQAAS